MTIFHKKNSLSVFEGHRLIGSPDNIELIIGWIVQYGLPRLTDPTPDLAWTAVRMVDSQGKRHTPGVYINPNKGVLVIRNRYKQALQGDYGDWVFRDMVNDHFFIVKQPVIDAGLYSESPE